MPQRWISFFAFAGFLVVVTAGQISRNAQIEPYGRRFSDEPAHYVTTEMLRHYLTAELGTNPKRFAEEYYARLPKVALGHWPPGFYVAMAPFAGSGRSYKERVLFGIAVLHAAAAWLCFRLALPLAGVGWALLVGFATTLTPAARELADAMMAEPLVAICELLAVAAAARLLAATDDRRKTAWVAVGFGLACAAAVLTKGTGFRLALLPLFGWLLLRDWRGPTRWPWWLAAVAVLAAAGPWYLFARSYQARHLELAQGGGLALTGKALWFYARTLEANFGVAAGAVLLWATCRPRTAAQRPLLAALAAHVLAVLFFQAVVVPRVGMEPRHLHSALLSLFVLLAWACRSVASARPADIPKAVWNGCFAAAFLLPGLRTADDLSVAPWVDYDKSVPWIGSMDFRGQAVLVASHPRAEGAAIAALAQRAGARPPFVALRSSKLFSESDWMGEGYKLKAKDAAEILRVLDDARVAVVVLNPGAPRAEHDRLLQAALAGANGNWDPFGDRTKLDDPVWSIWKRRDPLPPLSDAELSEIGRKWNLGEAQGFRAGH